MYRVRIVLLLLRGRATSERTRCYIATRYRESTENVRKLKCLRRNRLTEEGTLKVTVCGTEYEQKCYTKTTAELFFF